MIIIADSSSLILLAKSELLDVLAAKTKLIISQEVHKEVVEDGLKQGFSDALTINNLIEKKKINVKKVKKHKEFPVTLGSGEKESIELYFQEKANKIIIDDKKALQLCKLLQIPYLTTHIVLFDILRKKHIDKSKAMRSLEILNKEGRYSSEIILHYYEKIGKVK